MKTIIAAIDFSDASRPVLEAASKLAKALGEKLRLIHVVESEPTYAAYGFSPDEFPVMQQLQEHSVERAKKKLDQMAGELDIEGVEAVVIEGSPLQSILEYAEKEDAGMIVLGSHGHGILGSLLLGSVAEGCVRKAKFASLIIPALIRKEE